jgi:exodeoxyribonuclease V beta subunit
MKEPKEFNVKIVELQGSKLIEASAGTGKTYSVAILVLRMIIEKEIPIEKILMVTFTKAAVAELESRIRKFVRLAYRYASGKEITDETIKAVVGFPNEEKRALLRTAVQSLDNLSVLTIHGFCQKTIDEFTFETNQSFDYEIVTDDSSLFKDASNKYLREVLNILDLERFKEIKKDLKFDKMHELLRKYVQGMTFVDSNTFIELTDIENNIKLKTEALKSKIENDIENIRAVDISNRTELGKNRNSADNFLPYFIKHCCVNKNPEYISLFDFIFYDCGKEYSEAIDLKNITYLDFFKKSKELIYSAKEEKGYITYDDQIKTIHKALGNKLFKEKLAQKYEAVFIDEFQDTDKHQYEIFSQVFSGNSIIFYIGDPKQSIYGWRSADLDTYKQAKENVDVSVFSMNKNFRSTKKVIDALNVLLNPDQSFNMFMDEDIRYINVGQGASGLGDMTDQGNEVKPATIWEFEENDDETNYLAVAQEIFRLLTDNIKINDRRITPKDIGVLVRGNKEGNGIKESLAKLNIPAVKRDEAKVLESAEAGMIKYLLKAVISPNRGDINRALHSPYFGFSSETLKTIDDEKHIEIFIGLRKILNEEGVYNMISSFLSIYGVRAHCMKDVFGQRVLTNINQIAEILHKIEKQRKSTPDELLIWMTRSSDESNEEFEQRVESDDDAVQISTIHKAKGLEYNIVFAPGLSMVPKKFFLNSGKVNDFKNGDKYYFTLNYPGLSNVDKNNFTRQKEQENRRLIYVALTRAVYKCYISLVSMGSKEKPVSSSLSEILDHYKKDSDLIEVKQLTKDDVRIFHGHYRPQNEELVFSPKEKPLIEIKNTFGVHSFSALSKIHLAAPFEKMEMGDKENYDQFIFQDLGRGASVGTALHSIFELLDFNDPGKWNQTLQDASKYYPNIIKEDSLHLFNQLVSHIMNTELICGEEKFSLHKVKNGQKLPELEFYFSMDNVNKARLNKILGDEADLEGDFDIEGLMHGFIDLFFEHNGKYYILDWKSNHLGNMPEKYNADGLSAAMKGNNYNLQYYIYTVAMKRYLEKKLPGFDYEKHFGGVIYLFLRGVRCYNSTGIFYAKPALQQIENLENLFLRQK